MAQKKQTEALRGAGPATISAASKAKRGRKPGRPAAADGVAISGDMISRTAYEMARRTPLQNISMVVVARELGVATSLVHYHVGGREQMTANVMNLFYKDLLDKWPEPLGVWEYDLIAAAKVIYRCFQEYPGIASYAVGSGRFRVFQVTSPQGDDFGVEVMDRFTARVRAAGRAADRTGVYTHIMMEFIISTANGAANNLYPGAGHFASVKHRLDPKKYPNIYFSQLRLDSDAAFREGCRMCILGLKNDPEVTDIDFGDGSL